MSHAKSRSRSAPALIVSLSIAGAAALAVPSGTFAAQGDDEAMIAVIEQAMPAVVTIQVPATSFSGAVEDENGSDDQGQPEDAEGSDESQDADDARTRRTPRVQGPRTRTTPMTPTRRPI